MLGGFRLGRILGFPVEVRFSFVLLLGLVLLWGGGVVGLVLLGLTFVSVLAHELGHAVVARRLGVPIVGIDLHFFGGAAKMARMPRSPRDEILIAVAGPLVSLAIAGLAAVLGTVLRYRFVQHLAWVNLMLGVFNLLPALPMDGGRILRAALARRMGRLPATVVAVRVARVVAVLLGVTALALGQVFLVALAVMLWIMASVELRTAHLWSYGPQFQDQAHDDGVEVLDRSGRPIRGSRAAPVIEEQQGVVDGRQVRRFVIRGPDGRVLFVTEQAMRW